MKTFLNATQSLNSFAPTNSVKKLCRSAERPAASYPLKLASFLLFLSPFESTFLWNSVRRSLESRPRRRVSDAAALTAQCYLVFPSNIDNIPWNDKASSWLNAKVLNAGYVKYKKRCEQHSNKVFFLNLVINFLIIQNLAWYRQLKICSLSFQRENFDEASTRERCRMRLKLSETIETARNFQQELTGIDLRTDSIFFWNIPIDPAEKWRKENSG